MTSNGDIKIMADIDGKSDAKNEKKRKTYLTGYEISGREAEKNSKVAYEELEKCAAERTRELALANRRLEKELAERKKAQRALRESETRYRTVLEANPDPVVVYDLDGRVIYFNPAFEWVFGWSLEERYGKKMDQFVPEESRPETDIMIEKIMAGVSFSSLETVRFNKNGEKIPVSISSSVFRDSEGEPKGAVSTIRDVSEKKRLEAKLQQSQKLEAIGTLAGGIAHDFNNLLTVIQGYASILMETEINREQKEKLKKIETFIQSGASLTKQILGFAKGGKYEVKVTDLNKVVQKTAEMFARTRKQIVVLQDYQADLWAVKVDRSQLEQVLLNICVNAWQAMPDGGEIHLKTRNSILDDALAESLGIAPGRCVKLSVVDNGAGMEEEILSRIFDPFFTTRDRGRGTGLGLASAYGIIKNHQGAITASSEPGKGSTFTIFLPATDEKVKDEGKFLGVITRGAETILLVDDEKPVLEVGRELLEDLGYEVLLAGSGDEAVRVFKKMRDKIDLVILDMIMPGLSGVETFEQLKSLDEKVRVLLSSGYSINNQASKLIEHGCVGFLMKPYSMKSLSCRLRKVLDD